MAVAAQDKAPLVVIVILAYNCAPQVRRCLQSLAALRYPNYRLLVVDNASRDDVEQVVKAEFPDCDFLQTGENLGYTGGNNRGIAAALAQGAAYVLILNPDTVLLNPDFLAEMVRQAETQPRVGIAGPRVFLRSATEVQNTVLFAPGLWRNVANWVRYRLNPASFVLSQAAVVDAEVLNGVCVLLRAACLREIGLFDENIFMYIEDADLDFRARAAGWRVQYWPVDSIIHEQKRDGYHMTSNVSFLLRRNSVYYLCKIGKRFEAWGYAGLSLLVLLGRGGLSFDRAAWQSYVAFCRRLARSYQQILLKRPLDEIFGPPFAP